MTPLADEFEAAVKAMLPQITIIPQNRDDPNHRWVAIGWDRFMVAAGAPVTPAGAAEGYHLWDPRDPSELETYADVAPLLARIEAIVTA